MNITIFIGHLFCSYSSHHCTWLNLSAWQASQSCTLYFLANIYYIYNVFSIQFWQALGFIDFLQKQYTMGPSLAFTGNGFFGFMHLPPQHTHYSPVLFTGSDSTVFCPVLHEILCWRLLDCNNTFFLMAMLIRKQLWKNMILQLEDYSQFMCHIITWIWLVVLLAVFLLLEKSSVVAFDRWECILQYASGDSIT